MNKIHAGQTANRNKFPQSVNLNIHTDFPYLMVTAANGQSYPRIPGFRIMHWHEDLQFIQVLEGSLEIRTLQTNLPLAAGSGVFINKNVVHYIHVPDREHCCYNSFLFPDRFLGFYPGSPVKPLVEGITMNESLPLLPLSNQEPWQKEVLDILQQLQRLEAAKPNIATQFYAYEVLLRLSALWLIMVKNIALPNKATENVTGQRMHRFLQFIEANYGEDITLSDLADSANVSKSECARCFRQTMDTTPYKYLLEYRLSQAARLLTETTTPIGDVAAAVGFRDLSHFDKCFKEKTGYSPRSYRETASKKADAAW